VLYKDYNGIAFIFAFCRLRAFYLIYTFFYVINTFTWKITCVAGMGISLCVLRADTFMCLLLDGIEVLLCTVLPMMKGSCIIFKIFLIPEFWFLAIHWLCGVKEGSLG